MSSFQGQPLNNLVLDRVDNVSAARLELVRSSHTRQRGDKHMVEMSVDSIRVSVMNSQRVVILKETHSDRYLPIWIGPAEADAIAVKLQGISVPRPLTHDLLFSILNALGAKIKSIFVNDLQNDTFFARIFVTANGKEIEIDSRPSDAIAIAVRAKVPIYAAEEVLEKAGIVFDSSGKPMHSHGEDEKQSISDEELRKLSAFTDFINTLDMKDLGNTGDTKDPKDQKDQQD
jgi:bifunctional DNase/RNase